MVYFFYLISYFKLEKTKYKKYIIKRICSKHLYNLEIHNYIFRKDEDSSLFWDYSCFYLFMFYVFFVHLVDFAIAVLIWEHNARLYPIAYFVLY